ncbi:MAG TPA: fibronectin type III domain-containing protein, partial [Dyadobacter sp.]|nr:fibronectin type III domain-containing protein [Dyadobacter sp.]
MKRFIHKIAITLLAVCLHLACEEKMELLPPTLSAVSITDVGVTTAGLTSAITKSGNQEILDHGFTISLSSDAPVIEENSIKKGAIDRATPTPIAITAPLTGLQTATEYYVHAFVLLQSGPVFSEGVIFKTSNVQQPNVKTEGFEAVTMNSANLRGSILAKGSYPIAEYGIVWSGTTNPTTASASKYAVKKDVPNIPASFSIDARDLSPNTTYHFRAYAISNGITSYGADLSFKTSDEVQPKVQTGEAKANRSLAILYGEITGKGSTPITQYGICLATRQNPTVADAKVSVGNDVNQVPFTYSATFLNLSSGTTYHYRAFATMNGVTTYGENRTFQTVQS